MATSLGMKAMQSPLRSMARSKNVESSSNLSKLDAKLTQPKEVAHVCTTGGPVALLQAKLEVGGKINVGNIQIHRT